MLPRQALLAGNPRAAELDPVLRAAERALRTWQPIRTGFLDPALREAAAALLEPLSELVVYADGGYGGAERCQLVLCRRAPGEGAEAAAEGGADPDAAAVPAPLEGLEIVGNFLFDPARPGEFEALLLQLGASEPERGDLWLRGDRGAQVVVAAGLADRLQGREALLRSVPVRCEKRPLAELRPPRAIASRDLSTVEASLRLDALASAGFGLSRSRMAGLIRQGAVRLNWQPVSSPSRLLRQGDRVRLEGRGELTILTVMPTQRGRLRVAMRRGGG
jgi:photosystem II S4 domain protein